MGFVAADYHSQKMCLKLSIHLTAFLNQESIGPSSTGYGPDLAVHTGFGLMELIEKTVLIFHVFERFR